MASLRQRILDCLLSHPNGLSDGELTHVLGLPNYAEANIYCNKLAAEGLVERRRIDGKFRNFLRRGNLEMPDNGDDAEADELAPTAVSTALSLERDLELCLVGNLDQLEPGLRLYTGRGITGRQVDAGTTGRMDILAIDTAGRFVVIELKAGEADDAVCGQILRYMGWVKRRLANGAEPRGIIVANGFHERVRYAVEALPNVTLKMYEVRFDFEDVALG